jgi:hypothetical protein
MSSKISEMTAVTNLVGTEQIPAINAALEPIRIPVSSLTKEVYLAKMETFLVYGEYGAGPGWGATSIWSWGTVSPIVDSSFMHFDAYGGGFLLEKPGVYEVELTVNLNAVNSVDSTPQGWPLGSGAFTVEFEATRRDSLGAGTVEKMPYSKIVTNDIPLLYAPKSIQCNFATIIESTDTLGLIDLLNAGIKVERDDINVPFVPITNFSVFSYLKVSRLRAV